MSAYKEQKIIGLLEAILKELKVIDKTLGELEFINSNTSEISDIAKTIDRIEDKINRK